MLIALQGTSLQSYLPFGDRSACGSPPLLFPCPERLGTSRYYKCLRIPRILRLYGEYFTFYTRFLLNMSPSLLPSLLTFLLRC